MNAIANYPFLRQMAAYQAGILDRFIGYLEIGVCDGGSADAVLGCDFVQFAILIDPWGKDYGGTGRGSPDYVAKRLERFKSSIVLLSGISQEFLPKLTAQFDMIYVDGDHSPDVALLDLQESLRLLSPGGVILLDDVDNEHHLYLRGIAEQFAESNNLSVQFHNIHTGMAELRRKHRL